MYSTIHTRKRKLELSEEEDQLPEEFHPLAQDDHSLFKRCRLATLKRPAYEPASGGPSLKRSAPCEELKYTITWSLTNEEERLNLVSPLLISKVTVSVLIIAWH